MKNSQVFIFFCLSFLLLSCELFDTPDSKSNTGTETGTEIEHVAAPKMNPATGAYKAGDIVISIASTTEGASIRYTAGLVPSDPSSISGTIYNGPITISISLISNTVTVRAIAYKPGCKDSEISSETYTVNPLL